MGRRTLPEGMWMRLRDPEALRTAMATQGLSMRGLSDKAGCNKSFIGFLATGHKTSCSSHLAANISAALDVPVDALFDPKPSTRNSQTINQNRSVA